MKTYVAKIACVFTIDQAVRAIDINNCSNPLKTHRKGLLKCFKKINICFRNQRLNML